MTLNISRLLKLKRVFFLVGILALLIWVGLVVEVRKEVFFLCSNFHQGMPIANVTQQLNTATLSSYSIEETQAGKLITHSSWIALQSVRCDITINPQGNVTTVTFNQIL